MAIITALLSVALIYLGFNLVCGVVLCVYYFSKEKKVADNKELLNLVFFPATGLGAWIYNRNSRAGLPQRYNKAWHVYRNMVQVNWVFILLILAYGIFYFVEAYRMLKSWQQVKADGKELIGEEVSGILYNLFFGWMADMGMYIIAFVSVIALLFTFVFCFLILIKIPQWKMKESEQLQHVR